MDFAENFEDLKIWQRARAVAAGAGCIVTFNVRDFAPAAAFGVDVVTPAEFIALLAET